MSVRSTALLERHLKELKLPTFLREYGKVAGQCAAADVDHPGYLLRLSELELIDRHHRMVERRIKTARFPAVKSPHDLIILVTQVDIAPQNCGYPTWGGNREQSEHSRVHRSATAQVP